MRNYTPLLQWFTTREVHTYFGSRTQDEINHAVTVIGRMTPEHRAAFRRVLANQSAMRLSEKHYAAANANSAKEH